MFHAVVTLISVIVTETELLAIRTPETHRTTARMTVNELSVVLLDGLQLTLYRVWHLKPRRSALDPIQMRCGSCDGC